MSNTTGLKHISSGVYSCSKNRDETKRFPKSILEYHARNGECNSKYRVHPTQKPVALLEYLIKTYTNEGETVLDNTFGSCTTGIACLNTNRNFIGIEMDDTYFQIGVDRIEKQQKVLDNTDLFHIIK